MHDPPAQLPELGGADVGRETNSWLEDVISGNERPMKSFQAGTGTGTVPKVTVRQPTVHSDRQIVHPSPKSFSISHG